MHPRDLGPYGLQMQRLIVLSCVFAAIFITVLSGPRLIPTGYSTTELAQWVVYSPNLILPLGAGTCALVAILKALITCSYTHTWIDTGWFLVIHLYLACYMTLIIACVVMPVLRLSSPIPSLYAHAIVSDTNPILALYPLVALGCIAVLRGSYAITYFSAIAPF